MKLLLVLLAFVYTPNIWGQTCIHTQLSKQFDVQSQKKQVDDSSIITITIIDKQKRITRQKISYKTSFLLDNAFKKCGSVRSYATGENINMPILDCDFGDIVIADFNFDNNDDLAIKYDSGGNAGPIYRFYIQKEGQLILDKFLSDKMQFFPSSINKNSRTLTTLLHASAYELGETTYKFDSEKRQWEITSHRLVPAK